MPRLEHERGERIGRKRVVQRGGERLIDKRGDLVVLAAEVSRMLGICRKTLEAIDHKLPQGTDVLILRRKRTPTSAAFSSICAVPETLNVAAS